MVLEVGEQEKEWIVGGELDQRGFINKVTTGSSELIFKDFGNSQHFNNFNFSSVIHEHNTPNPPTIIGSVGLCFTTHSHNGIGGWLELEPGPLAEVVADYGYFTSIF